MTDNLPDEQAPQLGGDSAPTPSNIEPTLGFSQLLVSLREALKNAGEEERLTIIEEIHSGQTAQAVPLLIDLLENSPHPPVRQHCVLMLGHLADERAVSALVKVYESATDLTLEAYTSYALSQYRSLEALVPVLEALQRTTDSNRRSSIAFGLAETGDRGAVPFLLTMRNSPLDPPPAIDLWSALNLLRESLDLMALIDFMYHQREDINKWAIEGFVLRTSGSGHVHISRLERLFRYNGDQRVRAHAVRLIGRIDSDRAREIVVGVLDHPDIEMRRAAIATVAAERIDAAAEKLMERYGSEDMTTSGEIMRAIGVLRHPRVLSFLVDQVESEFVRTNKEATAALLERNDPATPDFLLQRLDRASGHARQNIIRSLHGFDTPAVLARLIEIIRSASDEEDQRAALMSVDLRAHPEASDDFLEVVHHGRSMSLRNHAIYLLGTNMNERVEQAFRDLITSSIDDKVRTTALVSMMSRRVNDKVALFNHALENVRDEKAMEGLVLCLPELGDDAAAVRRRIYRNAKTTQLRFYIMVELRSLNTYHPADLKLLYEGLADAEPEVRAAALRAVHHVLWKERPLLLKHLTHALDDTGLYVQHEDLSSKEMRICDLAAYYLINMKDPEASAILAEWERKNQPNP